MAYAAFLFLSAAQASFNDPGSTGSVFLKGVDTFDTSKIAWS